MPRIKLAPELKKAISGLSHKEKDKLLFRLIAKDSLLVRKLTFELLESEAGITKEDKRATIEEALLDLLNKEDFYSPGYLLSDLRHISGEITRHVRTTKDKYGDIYLNFVMLNTAFRLHGDRIRTFTSQKTKSVKETRSFNDYVVKRALRLLKQLAKLHEDHILDFEGPMKELGGHIGDQPMTMKAAIFHGLDVNWLLRGEVPN